MSDQEHTESRYGLFDSVRLVVRTLVYVVLGGLALAAIAGFLGPRLALDLYTPAVAALWTVFTAVVVQGVPFLLLGTVVFAAIGAFVPERVFSRMLPRGPALAVPVAGVAGAVLPGCASVPVAGSLMRRGVAPTRRPRLPAFRTGDQPRGPGRHVHRVPRAAADGGGPPRRLPRHGRRDGLTVGALRAPGVAAAADAA